LSTIQASVARPLTIRSALTNDPLALRGVDGRSMTARRYRDLAISFADDLVRQAAALAVQVETLQAKSIGGADVDIEQLTRLSNSLGRTLQRLGLKKRAPKTKTLADVLAGRA
jgi:hypothetical protein